MRVVRRKALPPAEKRGWGEWAYIGIGLYALRGCRSLFRPLNCFSVPKTQVQELSSGYRPMRSLILWSSLPTFHEQDTFAYSLVHFNN